MRVSLIVPPVVDSKLAPIGIAYLAAYLKSRGHDVQARDLNTEISISNDSDEQFWLNSSHSSYFFEKHKNLFEQWVEKIINFSPGFVGLALWNTTNYFVIKLAEMLKKRNKDILIVVGGFWCNLRNTKNLIIKNKNIDAVVYGEGELTLTDIVENFYQKDLFKGCLVKHNGEIMDGGAREEIGSLDNLPFPDLSFFPLDKYLYKDNVPICFSRGCGWSCTYCVKGRVWKKLRVRSAEGIYKEIAFRFEEFPKLQGFLVCDPSLNQDINMLSRLCDLIIENDVKTEFVGLAQIKPQMAPELLKKLRKAGFVRLLYGVESGSQRILNKMKRLYTIEIAERVIKDTYNAGIGTSLNFIIGFPGESEEDFQDTLNLIKRIRGYITYIESPSLCDIKDNYIFDHPEEFGVSNYNTGPWQTSDITKKTRKERKKRFNDFVRSMGIPLGSLDEED